LKYPAFSKISIFYPKDIEEQKKIASFMRGLDEQIVVKQQQLERLKQMKQACLGLLFADNQTLTPPLRFKGFSGEWIMMNFGELFVFLRNNSLSRAELDEKGSVKNVHYGDVLIKYGEIIDMRTDELPYIRNEKIAKSLAKDCILQNGDVVFADAAEDNAVGKCSEIVSMNGDKVVSGLHTIPCRPTRTFSEGFLGYCLNSNKFHDQLLPMIQGTKISSISKKALACTNIAFPENLKEQRRIASFFRNLDKQISSRKQQVEQLQQLKKACLNQMVA
jgi:type I restriction enzyme S subunit